MYKIRYKGGEGWAVLCNVEYGSGKYHHTWKHIWVLAEYTGAREFSYAYPILFSGE